jgi:hypothetical protein
MLVISKRADAININFGFMLGLLAGFALGTLAVELNRVEEQELQGGGNSGGSRSRQGQNGLKETVFCNSACCQAALTQ